MNTFKVDDRYVGTDRHSEYDIVITGFTKSGKTIFYKSTNFDDNDIVKARIKINDDGNQSFDIPGYPFIATCSARK